MFRISPDFPWYDVTIGPVKAKGDLNPLPTWGSLNKSLWANPTTSTVKLNSRQVDSQGSIELQEIADSKPGPSNAADLLHECNQLLLSFKILIKKSPAKVFSKIYFCFLTIKLQVDDMTLNLWKMLRWKWQKLLLLLLLLTMLLLLLLLYNGIYFFSVGWKITF